MDREEVILFSFAGGVIGAGVLTIYSCVCYGMVSAALTLLGGHMDTTGFIALLAVCVTVIGVAAVIGVTIYQVKQQTIRAEERLRAEKFAHELALKAPPPKALSEAERQTERQYALAREAIARGQGIYVRTEMANPE